MKAFVVKKEAVHGMDEQELETVRISSRSANILKRMTQELNSGSTPKKAKQLLTTGTRLLSLLKSQPQAGLVPVQPALPVKTEIPQNTTPKLLVDQAGIHSGLVGLGISQEWLDSIGLAVTAPSESPTLVTEGLQHSRAVKLQKPAVAARFAASTGSSPSRQSGRSKQPIVRFTDESGLKKEAPAVVLESTKACQQALSLGDMKTQQQPAAIKTEPHDDHENEEPGFVNPAVQEMQAPIDCIKPDNLDPALKPTSSMNLSLSFFEQFPEADETNDQPAGSVFESSTLWDQHTDDITCADVIVL